MDSHYKEIIRKNLTFLHESTTNHEKLLPLLEEKGIIQSTERDTIKSENTPFNQNDKLYSIIPKKSNDVFKIFIECLKSSGNESVAIALEKYEKIELKGVLFAVPPTTRHYIPRKRETIKVEECMVECISKEIPIRVKVKGAPGVGKSEFAKKYAKTFHDELKGHSIWVEGKSPQTIYNSFTQFLQKIEIPLSPENTSFDGQINILTSLFIQICELTAGSNCLIVFDNITEESYKYLADCFNEMRKLSPSITKPFILTTSSFRLGSNDDQVEQIDLSVFSAEEALQFVANWLAINEANASTDLVNYMNQLCEVVGCQPLALKIALGHIRNKMQAKSNSPETVMRRLLKKWKLFPEKLLKYPEPGREDLNTLHSVWQHSLHRIRQNVQFGQAAIAVLNILSYFRLDGLQTKFISMFCPEVIQKGLNKILDLLHKYFILDYNEALGTVSIHILTQRLIQLDLEESGAKKTVLADLFAKIRFKFKVKFNSNSTEKIEPDQIKNLEAIWQHVFNYDKGFVKEHLDIPFIIIQKYASCGSNREAFELSRQSVKELKSKFGERDRNTLKMQYFEGVYRRDTGGYAIALQVLEHVYDFQQTEFGPVDKDTILTARAIATLHFRTENYEKADKYYGEALAQEVKFSSNDSDPRTRELTSITNEMDVLQGQDDPQGALMMWKDVLEEKKKIYGEDHKQTLTIWHNIGCVKWCLKDYAGALTIFERVLKISHDKCGPTHPLTLYTRYRLAETCKSLHLYTRALILAREVYSVRVQNSGIHHPITIWTKRLVDELENLDKESNIKWVNWLISPFTYFQHLFGQNSYSKHDVIVVV